MPTKRLVVRRNADPPPARSPSKSRKATAATSSAAKPRTARTAKGKAVTGPTKTKAVAQTNGARSYRGGAGVSSAPAKGGAGLWGLKGGTTVVRFLSEPEVTDDCPPDAAFHWFEECYDESARKFIILGDDEEAPPGMKRTQRYVAAAYDRADGKDARVKYFKLPGSLIKPISKQFQLYGTVCDVDCFIEREGQNLNTEYSITFDRKGAPVRNLAKIRDEINVGDAIVAEAKRLAEMPDREPEKHTRRELMLMEQGEFIKLAHKLDVPTKGRKRSEVATDILEAES